MKCTQRFANRAFSLPDVASGYANYWTKRTFYGKGSTVNKRADTNMAVVSLFWDTDIADVTLSENALQD